MHSAIVLYSEAAVLSLKHLCSDCYV